MCFGDSVGDTLREVETAWITDAAVRDLPAHDVVIRSNDDGLTWAVLRPRDPTHLRFTICRVDPCVMVMIEDEHARRQFRALSDIADAMAFVRYAALQLGSCAEDVPQPVLH